MTETLLLTDKHPKYKDFELLGFSLALDQGDTIAISVNGEIVKTFTAKYINNILELKMQCKGLKTLFIDSTVITN